MFKNQKITVFAGIGNPINFFDLLKKNEINVLEQISFPDHYKYSTKELDELVAQNKEQEKAAESIKDIQREGKLENTQIQAKQPILSQIPRYVYLVAFFALLSGVFFPLITEDPTQQNPDNVIKGTAILFLGLFGAILVYKGTTDKITGRNNKRATLISFGLGMIAASLALIFTIASTPS